MYLDGETTVASATPLVHVSAGHFSHGPALFDQSQHIRVVLHYEFAQPVFKWPTKNKDERGLSRFHIQLASAHPLDWCHSQEFQTAKRQASPKSVAT